MSDTLISGAFPVSYVSFGYYDISGEYSRVKYWHAAEPDKAREVAFEMSQAIDKIEKSFKRESFAKINSQFRMVVG